VKRLEAAATARRMETDPATERISIYLVKFSLKRILMIYRTITMECGKLSKSAEMIWAIENDVAIGILIMMQGYNSEDIAPESTK
jgi:hypothetical protein